jgi:23S rRNA (guanosine2251-2'-O)-methyltransferase
MSKPQIIYGIHTVEAVLRHHPERIISISLQQGRDDLRADELLALADAMQIPVVYEDKNALEKKAEGAVHQGVLALAMPKLAYDEADLKLRVQKNERGLWLILDNITDPHNLGACLRTAAAAGVSGVVMPKDKSAAITPTVQKVSSGASEITDIYRVTNLARSMSCMREAGIWLVGTHLGESAQSLYSIDLTANIGLVMGAEGSGLRRLTQEHCDYLASIPLPGAIQSLNVSVATGICLFEAVRQRQALKPQ